MDAGSLEGKLGLDCSPKPHFMSGFLSWLGFPFLDLDISMLYGGHQIVDGENPQLIINGSSTGNSSLKRNWKDFVGRIG